MLTLKYILADEVTTSLLAGSPIWTQPVEEMDPSQIAASSNATKTKVAESVLSRPSKSR